MKILYVEDNQLYGETITEFLEDAGYVVEHYLDSTEAIDASFSNKYDLYLFDLHLPTSSGLTMLKELREADDQTPIIFLTSSDESDDLKEALSSGADGYITKPVDLDELQLRIKALLRRVYGGETISYREFSLDLAQQSLYKGSSRCHLKPKAFLLLQLLLQNRNRVLTTAQIESHLWPQESASSLNAIRVYVTEIKQIIGNDSIVNIRGVGYQLND
jgi:DNA-binding response OmpR family regulator